MEAAPIETITARRWLVIFAGIHLVVWTLLPTLLLHNAPIDVIEGVTWGRQWAWGYDKHPWLAPWLTAATYTLGGYSAWPIYLLSQIAILVCGFATWRLAITWLPSAHATLAVLLLEGIYYYNAATSELNPNLLMLPIWALTILIFYRAIQTKKLHNWLLLGLYAGLAVMTKYTSLILLFSQGLFLVAHPTARRSLKQVGPYAALFVCVLVMTPHIMWLIQHDFLSLRYFVEQTSQQGSWSGWKAHVFYPVRFTLNQLLVLTPVLLILIPCFLGEKRPLWISRFDKQFLVWSAFSPFALTVLLSFLTGMRLRNQYGTQLFSLFGLLLIAWVQPKLEGEQFYKILRNIGIVFVLYIVIFACSAYTGYPRWTHAFRANFPGPEIAESLTTKWHAEYHRPLRYVGGSRWLSGNLAFYSPDHPTAYFNWDPAVSFWIDETDLHKQGALFIWDVSEQGASLDPSLLARFPRLVIVPQEHYSGPTTLGVAILPPLL